MPAQTPPASVEGAGSGSGYAGAFGDIIAAYGGIEFGGDSFANGVVNTTVGERATFVNATTSAAGTSGTNTITIPTASNVQGRIVVVSDGNNNAGTNNVVVATEGAETIDGSASATINSNGGQVRIVSTGNNWLTW